MGLNSAGIFIICGVCALVAAIVFVVLCYYCPCKKGRKQGRKHIQLEEDVEAGLPPLHNTPDGTTPDVFVSYSSWHHPVENTGRTRLAHPTRLSQVFDGATVIDLHHYYLQEAMYLTEEFIEEKRDAYVCGGCRPEDRFVTLITGRGLHSRNGVPVIKHSVEEFLQHNNFDYQFVRKNSGIIRVDLRQKIKTSCRQVPEDWEAWNDVEP